MQCFDLIARHGMIRADHREHTAAWHRQPLRCPACKGLSKSAAATPQDAVPSITLASDERVQISIIFGIGERDRRLVRCGVVRPGSKTRRIQFASKITQNALVFPFGIPDILPASSGDATQRGMSGSQHDAIAARTFSERRKFEYRMTTQKAVELFKQKRAIRSLARDIGSGGRARGSTFRCAVACFS